jgi:SAM-dependent methyltransferase
MPISFDALIDEADSVDVSGWDFCWLEGRATEQRPPWGYQRLLAQRLAEAKAALDIQTGGGEVVDGVPTLPTTMAATESWPPNCIKATSRLHHRGVVVVATPDERALPFADAAFDLVSSRHPNSVWWDEVARVLAPGGRYLAQHIGARTNAELYEWFLGPRDDAYGPRHHDREKAAAAAAGFEIVEFETARLRVEFFDIGAVVYFLRKVIWCVPDFSVERYRDRLRALHERIVADGVFVSHSTRTLFEAVRA